MGTKKKNKRDGVAAKGKGKSGKPKSRPARRKALPKQPKIAGAALAVLNSDKLKELYVTMVRCRMLAEHMQSVQPGSAFSGLEATLVGAGAHLLPRDCIALEHGGCVASFIKGTPLHLILARSKDLDRATSVNMSTVLSLAEEMKGAGAVTLMFCMRNPDTLMFQPDALALAATQKLPMVCLVESSFNSRLELPNQHASGPYVGADPTFYPRIPVDGNDVVGVFRVAQEAIRRAREGHGPAVIECLTSRANIAAETIDDRDSAQYTADDPLFFMEQYLRRRDLWSDEWSQAMVADFNRALKEASSTKENLTDRETRFDNVYSADGRTPRATAASVPQDMVPTP
jgi:TPP-dependent pyruvate/acetoin dehydrogenase alpha subunit